MENESENNRLPNNKIVFRSQLDKNRLFEISMEQILMYLDGYSKMELMDYMTVMERVDFVRERKCLFHNIATRLLENGAMFEDDLKYFEEQGKIDGQEKISEENKQGQ